MYRAMAMKEFREIRGIVLLAVAAYGLLVAAAIGSGTPCEPARDVVLYSGGGDGVPFVSDDFTGKFYPDCGDLHDCPGVCGSRWASRSAGRIRFCCIVRPTAAG